MICVFKLEFIAISSSFLYQFSWGALSDLLVAAPDPSIRHPDHEHAHKLTRTMQQMALPLAT